MANSESGFVLVDLTTFVEDTINEIGSFPFQFKEEDGNDLIDDDDEYELIELDPKETEEINQFISTKINTYAEEYMKKLKEIPLESQHNQIRILLIDIMLKMITNRMIEKSKEENPEIHEMVLTKKCTDSISEIARLHYQFDILQDEIKSLKSMLVKNKD